MNGDTDFQMNAITAFVGDHGDLEQIIGEYDLTYSFRGGPVALGFALLIDDIYRLVFIHDDIDEEWESWMN